MFYKGNIVNVSELDETCVRVYDPHEPDVSKKLIGTYANANKAANKLGVRTPQIHKSFANKSRFYSNTLKKDVTCRLGKIPEKK